MLTSILPYAEIPTSSNPDPRDLFFEPGGFLAMPEVWTGSPFDAGTRTLKVGEMDAATLSALKAETEKYAQEVAEAVAMRLAEIGARMALLGIAGAV